jgi:hypothetical protein
MMLLQGWFSMNIMSNALMVLGGGVLSHAVLSVIGDYLEHKSILHRYSHDENGNTESFGNKTAPKMSPSLQPTVEQNEPKEVANWPPLPVGESANPETSSAHSCATCAFERSDRAS